MAHFIYLTKSIIEKNSYLCGELLRVHNKLNIQL